MGVTEIIKDFDKLKERWDTKGALFGGLILTLITYFTVINLIGTINDNDWKIYIYMWIPIILLITLILFWVYSTNRFFIKFNNKITVGIILINTDMDNNKHVVLKILRKVILHINNSNEFSSVNLKILPTNFCLSDYETKKYHNNFSFMYDIIIKISVEDGKFKSIEKIKISEFSITFKPKNRDKSKRVLFDMVDLTNDMNLLVNSKDWEYTIENSGVDKKKYFENIHHVLLYYIGFYFIYMDKFEESLSLLSPIYDSKKTVIPISKKEGNKIEFTLKPFNLSEGRISTILFDLFFYCAVVKYINSDTEKALEYFEKLETIIKSHPKKFEQYINMARYSYELGYLDDAIKYNMKALKIDSTRVEIYLNLGFFSILNNDITSFCENYLKIFNNRFNNNINWVDVLEFQIRKKEETVDREEYFNFSLMFIEYVFLDSNKKDDFIRTYSTYKDLNGYKCIYNLGELIINNRVKPRGSNFTKKKIKRKK